MSNGTNELVFLHSPIGLLKQFVSLLQERFSTGQLPWTYGGDENTSQIFIVSEFEPSRDVEDMSPALVVSRGAVVHKRDVVADTDQNNFELVAKGGKYYWGTGELDIRIQSIGQTKGEASLLGDIVQATIHMTRDPICEAFSLRDISPIVLSQVVEYERDQQKWACTVDFRVFFEQRWFVIPEAPTLNSLDFNGQPVLEGDDDTPIGVTQGVAVLLARQLHVPDAGAVLYLAINDVPTSSVPVIVPKTLTLTAASVAVNEADGVRDFLLEILVNATVEASLALPAGSPSENDDTLTVALQAGDAIDVRLRRTSGTGKSTFDSSNATLLLE